MARIVEIKKMWHQERERKMPIMFLDCGHGFVHIGNQHSLKKRVANLEKDLNE